MLCACDNNVVAKCLPALMNNYLIEFYGSRTVGLGSGKFVRLKCIVLSCEDGRQLGENDITTGQQTIIWWITVAIMGQWWAQLVQVYVVFSLSQHHHHVDADHNWSLLLLFWKIKTNFSLQYAAPSSIIRSTKYKLQPNKHHPLSCEVFVMKMYILKNISVKEGEMTGTGVKIRRVWPRNRDDRVNNLFLVSGIPCSLC